MEATNADMDDIGSDRQGEGVGQRTRRRNDNGSSLASIGWLPNFLLAPLTAPLAHLPAGGRVNPTMGGKILSKRSAADNQLAPDQTHREWRTNARCQLSGDRMIVVYTIPQ